MKIKFNRMIIFNSTSFFETFKVENYSIHEANLLELHSHIVFWYFIVFFQKKEYIPKDTYD